MAGERCDHGLFQYIATFGGLAKSATNRRLIGCFIGLNVKLGIPKNQPRLLSTWLQISVRGWNVRHRNAQLFVPVKKKVKLSLCNLKFYGERASTDIPILKLDTKRMYVIGFKLPTLHPGTRYPDSTRSGGPFEPERTLIKRERCIACLRNRMVIHRLYSPYPTYYTDQAVPGKCSFENSGNSLTCNST